MTRAAIAAGALVAAMLVLLVFAVSRRSLEQDVDPAEPTAPAFSPAAVATAEQVPRGFIYGRISTHDGASYEGRMRWGGDEEAFWGDYFNGQKEVNPWAAHAPADQLKKRRPVEILGVQVALWEEQIRLGRPFMARFGDIARIEPDERDLRVTLKSGTLFHLDRFAADDLADGLRVWDGSRGVVDLDEWQIRAVDLLPATGPDNGADRLHGTVRTRRGEFTGFVQWDREDCVGSDELVGHAADGKLRLRFDTIRSIARNSDDSSLVTLLDGRETLLSDTAKVGKGNRGVYVDDRRYGRVLIPWTTFERVEFSPAGSGPAYGDFPPGGPLTGSLTTRAGRRLAGRLVYDLDESEITETLDAPSDGVHYTILFGLIASIVLPGPEDPGAEGARVTLHSGEELHLERAGDLGEGNAGMLIFVDGREAPEYVLWTNVERVDLDRPPAMYPSLEGPQILRSPGEQRGGRDLEPAGRPPVTGRPEFH